MGRSAIILLFFGCSGVERAGAPSADAFEWSQGDARVGRAFAARLRVAQPGKDKWQVVGARIERGRLPPGLTQEEGRVEGTPTKAGEWTLVFRVKAVSARAERVEQEVPWKIVVGPP